MHLTESDIVLFVDNVIPTPKRRILEEHLADCPACVSRIAAVVRIAKGKTASHPPIPKEALKKAAQLVPTTDHALLHRRPGQTIRFALAGGTLAACVLVAVFVLTKPEVARFRNGERTTVSQLLLAPADGAQIRTGEEFRWRAARDADAYRLTLFDEVGLPVWEQVVPETTLTLPPTVSLKHGNRYLWRVESLFPDQSIERSELHAITLAP